MVNLKLCLGTLVLTASLFLGVGCDPRVDRCAAQCITDYDCREEGTPAARLCNEALDHCLISCDANPESE